jgi:hypothetical protein
MGTAQQEIPVAKQAVLIQYQENWPGNPGWWRWSRPVLRHIKDTDLEEVSSSSMQFKFCFTCQQAREEQKKWDRKYPNG